MVYDYQKERTYVFTERGQENLFKIRDIAFDLIGKAGCVEMSKLFLAGDAWESLACVDRLVEMGYLEKVNQTKYVAGQNEIYRKPFNG